jgi:alpha-L-fucosidase 2
MNSKICCLLALLFVLPADAAERIAANQPRDGHGLHFMSPVTVWDEALPLGNGIMGALVWGDGKPVKISLDRSDLWDLRLVPEFSTPEYKFRIMREWHLQGRTEDLVRLYEQPYNRPAPTRIPAGRIELSFDTKPVFVDSSLSLADATANMRFRGGHLRAMVHAVEPVGMISIQSSAPVSIALVAPAFAGKIDEPARGGIGAGDLAQLGYPAPQRSAGPGWQAFLQQGAEGFRFAVYVCWKSSGGSWMAAWSVASSFEGPDPLALARKRSESALARGYDGMAESHRGWWRSFWQKSSVSLPNPVLERQWYLETYKFGATARRGAPPISLQAIWTADDGKLPPWKGDYHHDLNTQLSYWPCYGGNHLEEGLGYLDYLWNTRAAGFAWTQRFFEMPGLNVPMTADLNGNQIGGWRQYTHSATTAAWLAQHFYLHWKYSADREFLAQRAYPYIRDAAVFLEAFTNQRGPNGLRTFPLSSSPEINDNRPDAWFTTPTNYDLALSRWLFAAASELAAVLGLSEEGARWRRVLEELPELSIASDGRLLVAKDYPLPASHRHFSHLMAIHPLGLIDPSDGAPALRTIQASLSELDRLGSSWWTGYSFAWLGNLAARAYDGQKAEHALEVFSTSFTLRNSFHCNGDQSGKGYSKFTYRPFTLEGNFAAAEGIQEMLLQSHRGKILIFPAIPTSWQDASFTTLRAEGAFLVSAKRTAGKTVLVEILSEKGGTCRLISPFSGKEISISMKPGEQVALEADPGQNTR